MRSTAPSPHDILDLMLRFRDALETLPPHPYRGQYTKIGLESVYDRMAMAFPDCRAVDVMILERNFTGMPLRYQGALQALRVGDMALTLDAGFDRVVPWEEFAQAYCVHQAACRGEVPDLHEAQATAWPRKTPDPRGFSPPWEKVLMREMEAFVARWQARQLEDYTPSRPRFSSTPRL